MVTLENAYKVIATCPSCGETHCFYVDELDYHAWECGCLIQNAFPYLTSEQRELLMGGMCDECWGTAFGVNDDDDDFDGNHFTEEMPCLDITNCTDEEFHDFMEKWDKYYG